MLPIVPLIQRRVQIFASLHKTSHSEFLRKCLNFRKTIFYKLQTVGQFSVIVFYYLSCQEMRKYVFLTQIKLKSCGDSCQHIDSIYFFYCEAKQHPVGYIFCFESYF